jgi:hypothetical protein
MDRAGHVPASPFVALRSSGVWLADVCFHDCDNNATRPALTAALVYPPRVVRRRRRLLTAAGCEPEQALRRSRVAGASPREAALFPPRRQLRAAPTPASSRGCTGLARAASGPRPIREQALAECEQAPRPGVAAPPPAERASGAESSAASCAPVNPIKWHERATTIFQDSQLLTGQHVLRS